MTAIRLRWGVLGPGRIARSFAIGLAASRTGRLVAAGSRNVSRAQEFLDEATPAAHGAPTMAHGSYEALLADTSVDAIYLALPHPHHARWAIAAAQAGKHLLIEKPITVTRADAMEVFEAARRTDVFAMEAYMYRCHPQTATVVDLIATGAIGEVIAVQASFAYAAPIDFSARTFDKALAGGGILDVGGYPVSMARLLAGAALGVGGQAVPFAEPESIRAVGTLGSTGVDDWTVANLTFASGILAQVTTGVGLSDVNTVTVLGSRGKLHLPNPWQPGRAGGMPGLIEVHRPHEEVETLHFADPELYAAEADHVAEHLAARQAPAVTWADSLGTMAVLDEWRAQIGLHFDQTTLV